jgi:uncharacterized tellurite resistance protein B-like protein
VAGKRLALALACAVADRAAAGQLAGVVDLVIASLGDYVYLLLARRSRAFAAPAPASPARARASAIDLFREAQRHPVALADRRVYAGRMDLEERYKIRELLETMIAADGRLADEEREFLRRIVERLGLPFREAGPFSESDVGRATTTIRTLAPDVQLRVMALLVDAAVVDGCVDPEEHALLLASAATLGIEATALEERIAARLRANASK